MSSICSHNILGVATGSSPDKMYEKLFLTRNYVILKFLSMEHHCGAESICSLLLVTIRSSFINCLGIFCGE